MVRTDYTGRKRILQEVFYTKLISDDDGLMINLGKTGQMIIAIAVIVCYNAASASNSLKIFKIHIR